MSLTWMVSIGRFGQKLKVLTGKSKPGLTPSWQLQGLVTKSRLFPGLGLLYVTFIYIMQNMSWSPKVVITS